MLLDTRGELSPRLTGQCTGCRKCLQTCPFSPETAQNEDSLGRELFAHQEGIRHDPGLGWYQQCLVGHLSDAGRRWSRSSGGLGSWVLATLLEQGTVDRVVCVVPKHDPQRLFQFAILTDTEQVWAAARSCYYPVEWSEALRQVRQTPGRTAFVALPCYLKALRRACALDAALRERVAFTVGLTCGGQRSRLYAQAVARLAGLRPEEVCGVDFRGKREGRSAGDFAHCLWGADGDRKQVGWSDGPGTLWTSGCFKLNACEYCDDVFAELADVSLMDAWLKAYASEAAGTSLAIVRSSLAKDLLAGGQQRGELALTPIALEQVIRSQQAVIRYRRDDLAIRLHLARKAGLRVPSKRVAPRRGGPAHRHHVASALRRVEFSKRAMLESGTGPGASARFDAAFARMQRRDRLIQRLLAWPAALVRRIAHRLRRQAPPAGRAPS